MDRSNEGYKVDSIGILNRSFIVGSSGIESIEVQYSYEYGRPYPGCAKINFYDGSYTRIQSYDMIVNYAKEETE